MSVRDQVAECNEEALLFDGFDEAIIGVGQQHGMNTVAVYDRQKCIDILVEKFAEDAESEEQAYLDAVEYFDFNVGCAYMGKHTPIVVELFSEVDEDV